MDLTAQLVFCKKCQLRKFTDTGIVCSLTQRKPEFEGLCADFKVDAREAERLQAYEEVPEAEEVGRRGPWGYFFLIIGILRLLVYLFRDR